MCRSSARIARPRLCPSARPAWCPRSRAGLSLPLATVGVLICLLTISSPSTISFLTRIYISSPLISNSPFSPTANLFLVTCASLSVKSSANSGSVGCWTPPAPSIQRRCLSFGMVSTAIFSVVSDDDASRNTSVSMSFFRLKRTPPMLSTAVFLVLGIGALDLDDGAGAFEILLLAPDVALECRPAYHASARENAERHQVISKPRGQHQRRPACAALPLHPSAAAPPLRPSVISGSSLSCGPVHGAGYWPVDNADPSLAAPCRCPCAD